MKKLLFTILAVLCCTVMAFAKGININGIYYILDTANKTAEVTYTGEESGYFNDYAGSISIPSTVNYEGNNYTVTSIGESAFEYCFNLTSITIPSGVTYIGDNAFLNCWGLTEIYVFATTPPTLGVNAFHGVEKDILVLAPDVETYTGWGEFTNLIKNVDLATAKEEAIAKIDAAVKGVTDEGILAVANQAKTDISDATTLGSFNSIETLALADLAILLKYYNSGKDDALGALGTPQTGCPAVKVTKGDKTVILYAPDAVEMIKIPATTNK